MTSGLEFEEKSSGTVDKHILGIDKLIKVAGVDENHHGGVASDLFVFGNTGRGTELLPKTYAYVYVWAEGSLYVGDDLLYDDLVLEFYVIQGVREDGIVTSLQEDDLEIYVFIERDYGDMQEFEGGKLYLFWDDGINFKSV